MTGGLDSTTGATTVNLDDLVALAWAGHIRVPHFQRDFRWTQQDVLRLFDSIIRGYPIGSLLLWVRPATADTLKLGNLEFEAPNVQEARWVVDGQQRITSLANALHPSGQVHAPFALSYDLDKRVFIPTPNHNSALIIPLYVLFDLQQLVQWFAERPEIGTDRLPEASAVTKALREFKVPAYHVRYEDEVVLQDIFDRLNNYGKHLTKAEVFSALYAGTEAGKKESLSIALIADRLQQETGFGRIDDGTVLRAILARRGPDVEREIRLEFTEDRKGQVDFPSENRDAAYAGGQEALLRATLFLQEHAGVPHVSMLAYRFLLVVLTRVFAHHPEPDARNLQLLRRWYWRTAVVGPSLFKGSTTGTTRALNGRVHPGDLTATVQDLLAPTEDAPSPTPDLNRFKTNDAATKIILASWWDLQPRSPKTARPYEITDLSNALEDQTTASNAIQLLVNRRNAGPGRQQWAASRILLPDTELPVTEADLLFSQQPLFIADKDWEDILLSHCMDPDMADLLSSGATGRFLELRQERLGKHLAEFLHRMCEREFEDTPPLVDLTLDDDEQDDDELD